MKVVIVGAGLTGAQLAQYLIQEKHDVSVIESDEDRARYVSNRLDCLVKHDAGNSLKALEDVGVARADALVCVTDSDEVNMITCGLAASLSPSLLKIARVRNDDYVRLSRSSAGTLQEASILGIDHFIHPDVEAARTVLNAVGHGAIGDVLAFSGTPFELASMDIRAKSALDGLALKDFHSLVQCESLVTLLERDGEASLPGGGTILREGDRIRVLAKEDDLNKIFRLAGGSEKPLRKIGIVGGGRVGALIAEGLIEDDTETEVPIFSFFKKFIKKTTRRIVMIEQDRSRCKELVAQFPDILVLNENISDESFVAEERLDDLDLIITATASQELNMIASMYLKSRGVRRAIAMVTGGGYAAIARSLGIDVVIPVKQVVVDSILSHLMGAGIKGMHRIGDGSLDIIEIEVSEAAPAADAPIPEFRLANECLVMLVYRENLSFIPRGDYVFRAGDRVVLLAKGGNKAAIEKFFGKS
jgi:trk system potassium uptake protein TrkA